MIMQKHEKEEGKESTMQIINGKERLLLFMLGKSVHPILRKSVSPSCQSLDYLRGRRNIIL